MLLTVNAPLNTPVVAFTDPPFRFVDVVARATINVLVDTQVAVLLVCACNSVPAAPDGINVVEPEPFCIAICPALPFARLVAVVLTPDIEALIPPVTVRLPPTLTLPPTPRPPPITSEPLLEPLDGIEIALKSINPVPLGAKIKLAEAAASST